MNIDYLFTLQPSEGCRPFFYAHPVMDWTENSIFAEVAFPYHEAVRIRLDRKRLEREGFVDRPTRVAGQKNRRFHTPYSAEKIWLEYLQWVESHCAGELPRRPFEHEDDAEMWWPWTWGCVFERQNGMLAIIVDQPAQNGVED